VIRSEGEAVSTNKYWRSDTPIEGLPANAVAGPTHFGLSRSSGTLTFDGASDGHRAKGIVRYEPDSAYSAEVARMYGQASPARLFELAVCGFDISYGQV